MTRRAPNYRFHHTKASIALIAATLGLTACDSLVGEGPVGPSTALRDSGAAAAAPLDASVPAPVANVPLNPASNTPASMPAPTPIAKSDGANAEERAPRAQPPCGQASQRAQVALETYCAGCHGPDSEGRGGFDTVLDVSALIASGKVIPNEADTSPLYKRIASGAMPPKDVQKRPADTDVQAVEDWIACGAPSFGEPAAATFQFLSIDDRLDSVLDDLRAMNPNDRPQTRYIDLSTLANAGYSKDQIQEYREAVSFLVNSLSQGRNVVAPVPIDYDQLIYRIDLEDYLWDANTWRELERLYPYAVIYDQDSRLFPFDEVSAEQIRRETETEIPIIQGDWLLSHASRPPLYHQLLELPNTLGQLEAQLGVNIGRNIADERVQRAGFADSVPSQNNRVIERHELGGNRGALWVGYDFANSQGNRNVFANPLDFRADGADLFFNLDNGLQAYFIVNGASQRLDKAPNNLVRDPLSRDGAVENGLSCMGCHLEEGLLPKFDEIRDSVLATSDSAAETEAVLALYADRTDLEDAFSEDQETYRDALEDLNIQTLTAGSIHELDDTHLGVMDINAVAAALGISTSSLDRALDASPQVFPPEIVALRTRGGGVQRDAFEAVIDEVIEGLGLGVQLRVNR